MAIRKPLVIVGTGVQELPDGDTVPGAGGLPPGGAAGDVLAKQSAADGDATWQAPAGGAGGGFDWALMALLRGA